MDTKNGRAADAGRCRQISHCKSLQTTLAHLCASICTARLGSPRFCRAIVRRERRINLQLNLSFCPRVHWRAFAVVSAFFLLLYALPTLADELPKFSDAEVNQFVSQYADLVTKYIQAYQAAKAGKASAFDQLKTQVTQLQDEVAKVAEKLRSKPEEAQRYEQFIADYTEKMIDANK